MRERVTVYSSADQPFSEANAERVELFDSKEAVSQVKWIQRSTPSDNWVDGHQAITLGLIVDQRCVHIVNQCHDTLIVLSQ